MAADDAGLVERGRTALRACDWDAAASRFTEALELSETAEALDGLGQALYWQGDYSAALRLRERAYARYFAEGDHRAAALVAVQLAMLHWLIYANGPATEGWLASAQRMAELAGDCPERGWVELFLASRADGEEQQRLARRAMVIARQFGDVALEYDAQGYLGRALVSSGAVAEGMRLIDESMAATSSGVVGDPWAVGEILCTLFGACEVAIDVRRAEGWLRAVDRYVDRTGELPVSAICRMHYGGLLAAAGRWTEAERVLMEAISVYDDTYRGTRFEPVVRLADLRVRQGRLGEARRLLRGYEELPEAAHAMVRLHLARGEPQLAETVAERHLSRRGRGLASAPVLMLLVDAHLAAGRVEAARDVADEVVALAERSDHPSLLGLAALARGRAKVARGEDAAEWFERALAAFTDADLPHELAQARLDLATALARVRPEVARAEARAALDGFEQVGAAHDADAAAHLLRELGDRSRSAPRGDGALTKREDEVLALLAEGCSNNDIAQRLYISPRTAEHHVSRILAKLDLTSRTEAAAYAVRRAADGRPPTPQP